MPIMPLRYLDPTAKIKGADISPFANALQALPEQNRRSERHNLLMQRGEQLMQTGEMKLENMSRDQQEKTLSTLGKVAQWAQGKSPAEREAAAEGLRRFDPDFRVEELDDYLAFGPEVDEQKPLSRAGKIQDDLKRGFISQEQAASAMKKSIGTTVNVGQGEVGPIPKGEELFTDPITGARSMRPIAGGPIARKAKEDAEKEKERKAAKTETQVVSAETALSAIDGIQEAIDDSLAFEPVVGTASKALSWFSESAAGRVRSHVGTLQSKVALGAMVRLKNASRTGATGFGQMNQAELQLLIDEIGALNPDTTTMEIFQQTLARIKSRWGRVLDDIAREVSAERLEELGLDKIVNQRRTGSSSPDPLGIR